MPKLLLKNICKKYDEESYAVKNVNLEVDDKDFVILFGPSGCGKSTTLRMIAGLEEISEGEMWLDGQFANYLTHKERDLSMVFQNYALYPTMSVYDNIAFSLKVRKVSKNTIKEKVNEIAEILGIQQLLKRMPKELSGGQKQRVAIASAIIRNPKILLMDEPLSNLDAKLRNHMRVEMSKLHKKLNNTIIYVTHDQTEAMTLGTKIVVLKDGEVHQIDTPEALYDNPVNKFVAGFIGLPSMNFIKCQLKNENQLMYFNLGNEKVYLPKSKSDLLIKKGYENKNVIIGIRPEHITNNIDMTERDKEYISSPISVKVDLSEMLGDKTNIYFKIGDNDLTAIFKDNCNLGIGDKAEVLIYTKNICIFDEKSEKNILHEEVKGGLCDE
ncbi:putative sugar ABC transporter, ATPase component [Clostridium neonatale]|uniref:ABC transporter ATP-binding protein n=1 Tax=Clostridium neonatale TaxID=137838 RepID=UPI00291BDAEE|nr:ABC transporter ATP-binding protein [Clostridium neonatale]CAI3585491.1 putative sugar ABC transporter, ATPase component [Clostridium neonatale]